VAARADTIAELLAATQQPAYHLFAVQIS